jgi:SH3-like domain-containing protein
MMAFGRIEQTLKWFFCLSFIVVTWLPVSVLADYIAVKVPIANIRSGPDQTKDILWKVEAYHPMYVLEKKGKWYHFKDFEGDEGWIHSSLVQKIGTVITKKNDCNVRSGPGTKYDIVFTTEKGIPFKVLKTNKKWLNVEHADGDRGWLHQSLVWPNR